MDIRSYPGYVAGFPLELGLRELGGWQAADGRTVRRGLLYRGSALVDLDAEQRERVDALGLRFVLDLRAAGEVEGRADYLPAGAQYLNICGMYDEQGEPVDFSPAGIGRIAGLLTDQESFLRVLYTSMAHGNPAVHALVERFVAHEAPLYFHCTAGKDRTGVCAAVLLALLGVPDDDIVAEYLLTNSYRARIIENPPADLPPWASAPGVWAKANGVNEEDLRATLAKMGAPGAARAAYFAQEFGLGEAELEALRSFYLV